MRHNRSSFRTIFHVCWRLMIRLQLSRLHVCFCNIRDWPNPVCDVDMLWTVSESKIERPGRGSGHDQSQHDIIVTEQTFRWDCGLGQSHYGYEDAASDSPEGRSDHTPCLTEVWSRSTYNIRDWPTFSASQALSFQHSKQFPHIHSFNMRFTGLELLTVAGLAAASPVERQNACSSYTLLNTRGTGEAQGQSSGFRTINSQIQRQVSGGKIYNTVYSASASQISTAGTRDVSFWRFARIRLMRADHRSYYKHTQDQSKWMFHSSRIQSRYG